MLKLNNLKWSLMVSLFVFVLSQAESQTITLRYVSGYCNKVEAEVTDYTPGNLYFAGPTVNCGYANRILASGPAQNFQYQLQKLVGGSFVDEGSPKEKFETSSIYRDLAYGQTYRVRVLIRYPGTPVYSYGNPCGTQPVGNLQAFGSSVNYVSNELEIVQYNQFDDNDITGTLQSTSNFGGNGTTFANRRKYCQQHVSGTDINYNIAPSFGADHWQINMARTNMTGGWAGGTWHDYEPTNSVNVFGEGWLGKYGSSAIWPGQYTVTMLAYRDCDYAPWASHNDYFEIIPTGTAPCRTEIKEVGQDVVVYPNPNSTGVLQYYTIGEEMERLEYTIYNMSGQVLEKGLAYGGAGEIDISNLNQGMYTVAFQSAQETVTKRITVVK